MFTSSENSSSENKDSLTRPYSKFHLFANLQTYGFSQTLSLPRRRRRGFLLTKMFTTFSTSIPMSLCINSRMRVFIAFLHPLHCACLISQISGLTLIALSTDAEVTGVSRRWSMVTRFGNVVLDTFWFFWWRHRGCCPGRQVPVLLCFTQTRNFKTVEVP